MYCAFGVAAALLTFIFVLLFFKWRVQETDVYEAIDSAGLENSPNKNEVSLG